MNFAIQAEGTLFFFQMKISSRGPSDHHIECLLDSHPEGLQLSDVRCQQNRFPWDLDGVSAGEKTTG